MIGAILASIPVKTVVIVTVVSALPIAIAGLLAAIPIMLVGLFLWLKFNLPAVDDKTGALLKHLKMYHADDADQDEKELKSERIKDYRALVENYYNLTTDMFHIIWGPHYSMYVLKSARDDVMFFLLLHVLLYLKGGNVSSRERKVADLPCLPANVPVLLGNVVASKRKLSYW